MTSLPAECFLTPEQPFQISITGCFIWGSWELRRHTRGTQINRQARDTCTQKNKIQLLDCFKNKIAGLRWIWKYILSFFFFPDRGSLYNLGLEFRDPLASASWELWLVPTMPILQAVMNTWHGNRTWGQALLNAEPSLQTLNILFLSLHAHYWRCIVSNGPHLYHPSLSHLLLPFHFPPIFLSSFHSSFSGGLFYSFIHSPEKFIF